MRLFWSSNRYSPKFLLLVVCGVSLGTSCSLLTCFSLFSTNHQENTKQEYDMVQESNIELIGTKNTVLEIPSLEEILTWASPFSQRRGMYSLLENNTLQELLLVVNEVKNLDSSDVVANTSLVVDVLFERLVWLDPIVALEQIWILNRNMWPNALNSVFSTWSTSDVDSAIAAAAALDTPWKIIALQSIFENRGDLLDSKLKELSIKWNVIEVLKTFIVKKTVSDMRDQPKEAIDYLLTSELSRYQKAEVMTLVFNRWIGRDGVDGLEEMLSVCVQLLTEDGYSFSHLVPLVATINPHRAWEHLLTWPKDTQQVMYPGILKAWVRRDFTEARSRVSAMESIEDRQKQMYLRQLYTEWAIVNPEESIKGLNSVPIDFRSTVVNVSIPILLNTLTPTDVLQRIHKQQLTGEILTSALTEVIKQWSEDDSIVALQWITENLEKGSVDRYECISTALEVYALIDPENAFKIGLTESSDDVARSFPGLEFTVVASLASSDRFEAIERILPRVREPARIDAYSVVGRSLLNLNRGSEAIELGKDLADFEQIQYFSRLASIWLSYDPDSLINFLPSLTDKSVQSTLAHEMLEYQEFRNIFTEDEAKLITTFVKND